MNETATTQPRSITESPVPDSSLFLLNDLNRAYLAGKTTRAQLPHSDKPNDRGWQFIVGGAVVYILLNVCGGLDAIMARMPDIQLPNPPDFPPPTISGMFLFLLILLVMGVVVVIRDAWEAHQGKPEADISAVKPSEKPIAAATPRSTGQVLEGTVIQAEKIVTREQYGHIEKLGVRYQFAAPGGVMTSGYAVGLSEDVSHPMAPVPGTPVRIYYKEDGKHYLL